MCADSFEVSNSFSHSENSIHEDTPTKSPVIATSPTRREKHTLDTRHIKNRKCIQEAVLIGILSRHCSIVYERPKKRSSLTHQLFKIKALIFDNEYFNVEEFLERQTRGVYENAIETGLNKKNATRRLENEKVVILLDFLVDICLNLGYFFETTRMRNPLARTKVDFVEAVYYKGKLVIDDELVKKAGSLISTHLFSLTTASEKECTVQKGDENIKSFFYRRPVFKPSPIFNANNMSITI
ncbi:hypothetical protein EDI_092270 [Entamoeba dispar SAW760]|uniref:Uncharacterized protein n=1 Tax=Entamoeba dispar (strain ATCC PRA-260 / SAW760) TaxID=370354 RepID=B0ED19_ENTDS|nr:uncharacterized protein EDI_092270 [Entamoeba dispar SAW760]EDR27436.1 hypothetical protein EDI_092270 [Entamoeba dispar SAW760]|eukprot:EDR27436.1 hypothetical protein EDI_092270 [Entamoeba dispar SAW760]